jgi:TolB protein
MMRNRNLDPKPTSKYITISVRQAMIILVLILILLGITAWPSVQRGLPLFHTPTATSTNTLVPSPSPSPTNTPTNTPPASPTPSPSPTSTPFAFQISSDFGTLFLAIQEGIHSHLFAYRPVLKEENDQFTALPLTRLTSGDHQDITPALNTEGTKLAFASNRNGVWDIFILNLENGELTQFTDSKEYEAHPTWSPDGNWLAYEAYQNDNLEIIIRDIRKENAPINLTNHPSTDHSPSWSGEGRRISFISTRNGTSQVWIADLDKASTGDSFYHLDISAQDVKNPTWSVDGRYLSWGAITPKGLHQLYTWDSEDPSSDPQVVGSGDMPLWTGDGNLLFTVLERPQDDFLTAYPSQDQTAQVMLPAIEMPGRVKGITWGQDVKLGNSLGPAAEITPTPLWPTESPPQSSLPEDRADLVTLEDVQAPYPELSEKVIRSFNKLRGTTAQKAGWDFLATLENAFLPLTTPLEPLLEEDWLYTGRGFAVSALPLEAEWMIAVREDFGAQTYWRLFVRTLSQQGSQGKPLHTLPWDFEARFNGSAQNFERGGAPATSMPDGYWIDFTELAEAYGWQRFPALPSWRTSFSSTRFQEFALTNGKNWQAAMLEIYPPEALYTPTPLPTISP